MASKQPRPRPGIGQEALSLEFSGELAGPTPHYFDLMSQAADAQAEMDAAREYAASQREHTPLQVVLDVTAEQRRRESAYAADRAEEDWADFQRAAETGQRWAPSRTIEPEPVIETYDPAPSHGYSYFRNPTPDANKDLTTSDELARQAPVYPTTVDRSIASQHLPKLRRETHERALGFAEYDFTPPAGIINEGDPVPEFPEPEPPFEPQVHVRDANRRWYRP